MNQKWYESGEKASKLLASQLKAREAARQIGAIRDKTGALITNHKEINSVFKQFYEELYRSEGELDLDKAKKFFEHLNLPKLSEEDMRYLERPITLEEVNKTIQSLPSGKTPGIDGIPSEFYKRFAEDLGPEMLKTFSSAIDMGQLPPSMTESIITLILKKGKVPLECGSYRPISLLCCDEKLFTKVCAIRINNVITSIIHPDQVGFVKGTTSSDSLRRLLHLI